MIEYELERNIAAKIVGLNIQGLGVTASWLSNADDEDPAATAFAAIAAKPRLYDEFMTPIASVNVTLTLAAKIERCPTGSVFAEFADQIMGVLQSWQDDVATVQNDLSTRHFNAAGFQLNGGTPPSCMRTTGVWTMDFDFTVRGVVVAAPGR